MLNSCRIWCGLVAALVVFTATPAVGQRVRLPAQLPLTTVNQPPASGFGTVTTTPPPSLTGPPATFGGGVQPAAPTWDPYNPGATAPEAVPYYAAPPAGPVVPQEPTALFPGGVPWRQEPGTYAFAQPDGSIAKLQRFLREVRVEYTWLAGNARQEVKDFDVNTVELNATFAIPFLYNTESPLLITPGFAVNYFEGPTTAGTALPPRVYDTYLDLAWLPIITQWLSADLGFRTGVYSDFKKFDSDSIRYMGRALGLLAFTPYTKVALGVVYLDRNDITWLPAGGIIWRPNPDARYDILFPNPKLARRLRDIGTLELWWYAAGEYGLGAWTVKRGTSTTSIDYNDIRVMLGLEWVTQSRIRGHFEIGYVFDREILYVGGTPANFNPRDTVMLRGGLAY